MARWQCCQLYCSAGCHCGHSLVVWPGQCDHQSTRPGHCQVISLSAAVLITVCLPNYCNFVIENTLMGTLMIDVILSSINQYQMILVHNIWCFKLCLWWSCEVSSGSLGRPREAATSQCHSLRQSGHTTIRAGARDTRQHAFTETILGSSQATHYTKKLNILNTLETRTTDHS